MSKRLLHLSLLLLLLSPLAASAECGFVHGEQGMTIVVGSKSNRCFDSTGFREAFRQSLVASVQAMEGEAPAQNVRRRAFDERNARGAKLWNIAERHHQASLANASYYGQR